MTTSLAGRHRRASGDVSTAGAAKASRTVGTGKRRDVQGLRMLAVLPVVANHLTDRPVGGFVGVDVFFVISGYLITGLLVRDLGNRAGMGTYIADFYRRRVRRLMPAAVLTIAATVAVAYLVLDPGRAGETRTAGGWSLAFLANWHFASIGTDYFAATSPPSALQHYWSLSVEEQFYLLWPVLLFVVAAVGLARTSVHRRRTIIAVASALTVVVSLTYGAHQSRADAVTAYFSTLSRGWELALGALVACLLPYFRAKRPVLTVMSWTGMGLIVLSLFVTRGGEGFPVPGAILPCVGALLVLGAANSTGRVGANAVLTNRVSVFVGDISYSVYLVHFPVIILLPALVNEGSKAYYAAAIVLTAALAVALFAFVEQPVLRSNWLQPRAAKRDRPPAAGRPNRRYAAAVVALLAVSVGFVAIGPDPGSVDSRTVDRLNQAARTKDGAVAGPAQAELTAKFRKALTATTWPELTPTYASLFAGPPEPADVYPCGLTELPGERCAWGDRSAPASRTIYTVGDSTSVAYNPTFKAAARLLPGWQIRTVGGYSCNFGDSVITQAKDVYALHCAERQRAVIADIKRLHPALLVVTNIGNENLLGSVRGALGQLQGHYGKLVMLPAPPIVKSPRVCYVPSGSPANCVTYLPPYYEPNVRDEQAVAKAAGGVLLPTLRWFAVAAYCVPFIDDTPVRRDQNHIAAPFAARLAPVFVEGLKGIDAL